MIENSLAPLSESMQMYIVTIARLWANRQPVPLSKLADVFSISPVSVNEMCRKLQDGGLVTYQPYKGASLTPEGEEKANYIIRRHRLWEVFLTEKLGFEFEEAHEIACQLEHTTPNLLADRLAAFLEFPSYTPAGEPIPRSDNRLPAEPVLCLDQLNIGQSAHVFHCEMDENTRIFLEQAGIRPGVTVCILATATEGLLLQFEDNSTLSLSRFLAKRINVLLNTSINKPDLPVFDKAPDNQSHKEVSSMDSIKNQEVKQNETQHVPLNKLRVGQRGIVVRVGGKGQIRQRMMDMGLVPGSEVKVVRVAPLGDPVEFTVKGYNLSLRKSESAEIQVEVLE
ncbi:MAG: FeoA domain-containing protein [Anaerolineae bacterium]|nr:FeoA domain-containing protein [Anaerolineae bacterium]